MFDRKTTPAPIDGHKSTIHIDSPVEADGRVMATVAAVPPNYFHIRHGDRLHFGYFGTDTLMLAGTRENDDGRRRKTALVSIRS